MEERKSVLETTKPSDALGRLTARRSGKRTTLVLIGAVVVLLLAGLVGLIISNASRGTDGVKVPKVSI